MPDPEPTDPTAPTGAPDGPGTSLRVDGLGYAAAVAELEEILDRLDDEALDVDVLAQEVRRAAELIRLCRGRIDAARVEVEEVVAELGALAPGADPSSTADTLADGASDDL
ncbi:MAG: exodeoxyribonuclease VII small subunit [Acidimicrobiales bacterium]